MLVCDFTHCTLIAGVVEEAQSSVTPPRTRRKITHTAKAGTVNILALPFYLCVLAPTEQLKRKFTCYHPAPKLEEKAPAESDGATTTTVGHSDSAANGTADNTDTAVNGTAAATTTTPAVVEPSAPNVDASPTTTTTTTAAPPPPPPAPVADAGAPTDAVAVAGAVAAAALAAATAVVANVLAPPS